MIQRIQTIYLAIAMIALALTLVFPFATYTIQGDIAVYSGIGFDKENTDFFIFPIIANIIVSIVLSLIAILSFKNRKRQILMTRVNFIVILLLIVFIFSNFNFIESNYNFLKEEISYGIGFLFPILGLVCILMANRAIKKDEDLIKSMDRIR